MLVGFTCAFKHSWVCVFVSYTGGFTGDRAIYVGYRFQDVEGDETNLAEPITTLPPALG